MTQRLTLLTLALSTLLCGQACGQDGLRALGSALSDNPVEAQREVEQACDLYKNQFRFATHVEREDTAASFRSGLLMHLYLWNRSHASKLKPACVGNLMETFAEFHEKY